jgi:hypothetical protein
MSEPAAQMRRRLAVRLGNGRTGHKKLREGKPKPEKPEEREPPGPSRLARLLALAHHFDDMIREGVVKDQAEIARLMKVTRARVTQIMNLLYLAPDIQEQMLFLTAESEKKQPASMPAIRRVVAEPEWRTQRTLWSRA